MLEVIPNTHDKCDSHSMIIESRPLSPPWGRAPSLTTASPRASANTGGDPAFRSRPGGPLAAQQLFRPSKVFDFAPAAGRKFLASPAVREAVHAADYMPEA